MTSNEKNRLFVANKPIFISSNYFLRRLKRKYKIKKAGFSGTLDPFAKGCLIVAFGQYTKLFKYLKKTPKTYRATIWLGTVSDSLDIENIKQLPDESCQLKVEDIKFELLKLIGSLEYLPPKFSAKKISGKRAYDLARADCDFPKESAWHKDMKKISSRIYDAKFINYNHPFITFDIIVSEGSYIRSIAQILLKRLGTVGTLSYLERLSEGEFKFDNEKSLNPLDYLDLKKNIYTGDKQWLEFGKKLSIDYFKIKEDNKYFLDMGDFLSIIEIKDQEVKYLLNKIELGKND